MAYSAPTTRATGFRVTAAVWNQDVVDNVAFLANPPACRVYHNAAQSIGNNNSTALAFNSERFDTDLMHDTATNNGRITIKTAGIYMVTCHVEFAGDSDYTELQLSIREGGTTTIAFARDLNPGANVNSRFMNVATVHKFAVNNYLEAIVLQANTSGGANNVQSVAARSPEFSAVWLGLG